MVLFMPVFPGEPAVPVRGRSERKVESMRWSRRPHKPQQTPETIDAKVKAAALQEARKGTAAEHPAIVVTPDKKAHSGAVVDGVFVEARETSFSEHPEGAAEQHARDVAAGDVPGENETMKDQWWTGREGGPTESGSTDGGERDDSR